MEKIGMLVILVVVAEALFFMKGGSKPKTKSIIGLSYCGIGYWSINVILFFIGLAATYGASVILSKNFKAKKSAGFVF